MSGFEWKPFEDLPEDWLKLAHKDLQNLAPLWEQSRKKQLKNADSLRKFNEKLSREWAIETGIIEGLYSIDRGTTQVLIEHGIVAGLIPNGTTDKPVERVVDILKDHQDTLEGLFDFVKRNRRLSTSYIKEIHASLTQNQSTTEAVDSQHRHVKVELLRGDWKKLLNSPTRKDGYLHQYCSPEHTPAEMDRLVALHEEHRTKNVPTEVEAAWLHHRFTQIHPFQDGNGRVARVLASLVFLRDGWFPLVINRDNRAVYISALEKADTGDLSELVNLFALIQRREFIIALSLAQNEVNAQETSTHRNQLLNAIDERLAVRKRVKQKTLESVFATGDKLCQQTNQEMQTIAQQLEQRLKKASSKLLRRSPSI